MLIVACQKCGEVKVLAGSPDASGSTRAMWTCSHCGAGQILELSISKDAKRGDLRKIIGGLALVESSRGKFSENILSRGDSEQEDGVRGE
ncbi:MAG: alcohol dehydrogenase [Synergistaceae bacterium]|nr:alcohol dehydrogenase [Synergistaceae bacterium]